MGLLLAGSSMIARLPKKDGKILNRKQPWSDRGCFFWPGTGAKPNDKSKPGENRGRKVTGLHPHCGYDRRTSEMG